MQLHLQKWRCNCICICNCICNCFPACFHQAGKQPRVRFKWLNSADMKWCLWISDDHKRWCKIAVCPLRCMRRGRDTIPIKSHLWPWRRKHPDKWTWCPAEVWKEDESEVLAGCLASSLRMKYKHAYIRTSARVRMRSILSWWAQGSVPMSMCLHVICDHVD